MISCTAMQNAVVAAKKFQLIIAALFLVMCTHFVESVPEGCEYVSGPIGKGTTLRGVICDMNADLRKIPSDLSTAITYLNMTGNYIQNLTESSFERYRKLEYLILKNNGIINIHEKTFVSLSRLQYLDLSNNYITELPILPPSLKKLFFNSMRIDHIPTFNGELLKLEELSLKNNRLLDPPVFLKKWPALTKIVLAECEIHNFTIDYISNLCNLKEIDFKNSEMILNDTSCDCIIVEKWMKHYRIMAPELKCPQTSTPDICVIPDEAHKAYSKCKQRAASPLTSIIVLVTIVIFIAIALSYFYFFKTSKRMNVSATYTNKPEHVEGGVQLNPKVEFNGVNSSLHSMEEIRTMEMKEKVEMP